MSNPETRARQVPETHREAIAPHLADDEGLKDAYHDDETGQTLVVTDRRFLDLRRGEESSSGRAVERVTGYHYEHVTTTKVNFRGDEPADTGQLVAGVIAGFAGLFGILAAVPLFGVNQILGIVAILFGLLFLAVGGIFLLMAYNTDSGDVSIAFDTADGSSAHYGLPKDQHDFATSFSEAVGKR